MHTAKKDESRMRINEHKPLICGQVDENVISYLCPSWRKRT